MKRRVTYKNSSITDNNEPGLTNYPESGSSKVKDSSDLEINIFEMARSLIAARKPIITFVLAVVILFSGYMFLQPNLYNSTATILPSGKSGSGMSAIKSLVGLSGPILSADENSSILFPVILKSNMVIDAVLDYSYSPPEKTITSPVMLTDYFAQDNPDRLRKDLKDITSIKADKQTGEIYVGVETEQPWLSQAILTEYLRQLEDFNLNKRQSTAHNNELYLKKQLQQTESEMILVEDNLERFQMTNLDWAISGSPEIQKEIGRRQRDVLIKSDTYALLMQQFEMAKFDAQKNVPIIRILDSPSLPILKSGPFRGSMIIVSFVMALFLSCLAVIVRDLVRGNLKGSHRMELDLLQSDLISQFPRSNRIIEKVKSLSS